MKNATLYFAFGSNMHPARMRLRCPGAMALGVARLPDYQLAERLYADLDYAPGAETFGVLYLISEAHVRALDAYEGAPRIYQRLWLEVEFLGEQYIALVYQMTPATKFARTGMKYPEEYRQMCSDGAKYYKVPNKFSKKRKKQLCQTELF